MKKDALAGHPGEGIGYLREGRGRIRRRNVMFPTLA
jgi:hypothetical protein